LFTDGYFVIVEKKVPIEFPVFEKVEPIGTSIDLEKEWVTRANELEKCWDQITPKKRKRKVLNKSINHLFFGVAIG
jgi:hypothetical protein